MRLVISAINFTEGGPLTILKDSVKTAADNFPEWEIIAFVNHKGILGDSRVVEIEFPHAKKNWLIRLWYEWILFRKYSIQLKPDVWLSLHDITPRVITKRQYVYCHNPTPFCHEEIKYENLDSKFILFRYLYGYLYGFFIKNNAAVIVQQNWLRDNFSKRYHVPRVIVARPQVAPPQGVEKSRLLVKSGFKAPIHFIYPAFPRVFKNFELLGECLEILEQDTRWRGDISITIDGSENSYAKLIYQKYKHLRTLKFIGLQSPEKMLQLYSEVDALIFPSLLETWGLPITEAKFFGLPILAIDMPYARETIGEYDQVKFFPGHNVTGLAEVLLSLQLGTTTFNHHGASNIAQPYAHDWKSLFDILLKQDSITENISVEI